MPGTMINKYFIKKIYKKVFFKKRIVEKVLKETSVTSLEQ